MVLASLVALVPFVLNANAFLFEPPSANALKRNAPHHHRRVAGHTSGISHKRRGSGDWVAVGCRTDNIATRALQGATTLSATMTNDACKDFCDQAGYTIAGTEWSQECFCDNDFHFGDTAPPEECDYMCSGNPIEVCGGSARMTVWKKSTPAATILASYDDWGSQGCFVHAMEIHLIIVELEIGSSSTKRLVPPHHLRTPIGRVKAATRMDVHFLASGNEADFFLVFYYSDSVADRALPVRVYVDGPMTIGKCAAKCLEGGFFYAGLEYADECYCGSSIGASETLATDGCTMPCAGANNENCGGVNRLNVFERTNTVIPTVAPASSGWTYQNCYTDAGGNRALGVRVYLDGGMTAPACMAACYQRGYQFAGVEYGDECYCANSIGSSGTIVTEGCNKACSGDSTTLCGGPNRLNVYKYTGSSPLAPPTTLETYSDWKSKGCYADSVFTRSLTPQFVSDSMTVQKCIDACVSAGFTVAGVEYSSECYCGNALPPTQTSENCIMPCAGDSAHVCGGPDRLNVYQKQEPEPKPEPEPEPEPEPVPVPDPWAPWKYHSCRTYFSPNYMGAGMPYNSQTSIQACTAMCDAAGWNMAHMSRGMFSEAKEYA
ncbi:hypothetical protein FRC17_004067 [Serendipita sp. 399]|nr:hypothetical protein FRC17_004067 [Serendipita sp. 399]